MKRFLTFWIATIGIVGARSVPAPIKTLAEIRSDRYPDANAVIVFDSTAVALASTGSATIENHRLVKILTSFGKKKFTEAGFNYCTLYDTVIVVTARVIGADGTIYPVSRSDMTDVPMSAAAAGSKFFLPNVRLKKITFSHLEPGAALEIVSRDELRHPPLAHHFDSWDIFVSDEPIANKTYSITAPAGIDLHWKVLNGELKFTKTEKNNTVRYQWQADTVDRIIQEQVMPPLPDVTTKLLVATEPDFATWSKWYYELSQPRCAIDSAIQAKVTALTRDKKTDEGKIQALFDYVRQEIRYVEVNVTGRYAGYEPARADQTFKRGEGTSRDKAALLVGMLKAINVDAYLALTNFQFEVSQDVAADQFNHAVVAIKQPDGGYYYLDPTAAMVRAEGARGYLLPTEMNKPVLVCTPAGEEVRRTPAVPAEKNMFVTSGQATLSSAGDLEGALTLKPTGFFDFALRTSLKQVPPDQRQQVIETFVRSISPSAEMTGFTTSDIGDLNRPLTMEMKYQVADYGIKVEDELNFAMPGGTGSNLGVSASGQSSPWSLAQRKYPLYFWSTMASVGNDTVVIPKGWKVKHLPASFAVDRDRFAYTLGYKVSNTMIIRSTRFFIKDPLIPVSDYADFRSLMLKIEDLGKESITLIKQK